MRYLFNVVMGKGEIADPEGSEFLCLDDARVEAKQIARDLIAEELQQGRTVEEDWKINVTDQVGNLRAVVGFGSLLFKPRLRLVYPKLAAEEATAALGSPAFPNYHDRTQNLRQEMRAIAADITATFEEIRARVAQL